MGGSFPVRGWPPYPSSTSDLAIPRKVDRGIRRVGKMRARSTSWAVDQGCALPIGYLAFRRSAVYGERRFVSSRASRASDRDGLPPCWTAHPVVPGRRGDGAVASSQLDG